MTKKLVIKEKRTLILFILVLLFQLYLFLGTRFTAWPEMTFWPYLILKGWLPYKDIAIAHTPLLLLDLSIFYKLFGVGVLQLKLYTWILVLLTDLTLFFVVKRIWDEKKAILSLAFYVSLQFFYYIMMNENREMLRIYLIRFIISHSYNISFPLFALC